MVLPVYCTRESVKHALKDNTTAHNDEQIDEIIRSHSRNIDRDYARIFYPLQATRKFDWPTDSSYRSHRLWLGQHDLISIDTLTVAGTTVDSGDIILYPDDGPPYTRVELDINSSTLFQSGDTWQKAVSITGLFGYRNDEKTAGTLAAGATSSVDQIDLSSSAHVGVGSLLHINDERVLVTDLEVIDSGQTWVSGGTAQANEVSIDVTDGTQFNRRETILIDSEKMVIRDIAGNTLTVSRAEDGSVLAAHTAGASIYVYRRATVDRGVAGTTAAAHALGDTVSLFLVPSGISALCKAESIVTLTQERAGYARVIGVGKFARETLGEGIESIREKTFGAYARKFRVRAV